jgi:type VI secretion system protein ImpM
VNLQAGPPGWYGKLPSLGDFASRRLDTGFIDPGGLLALREAAPDTWLDDYLSSPSWRFLLTPGVLPGAAGSSGWAGVLMPSVDRVGRYFPLTLVLPLGDGPANAAQMVALWGWLARLDELARDALHDDWSAERLEEELARMTLPDLQAASAADAEGPLGEGLLVECAAGTDAAVQIATQAQALWAPRAAGKAWWQARPDDAPARLLLSRGLPAASTLARLFGPPATI